MFHFIRLTGDHLFLVILIILSYAGQNDPLLFNLGHITLTLLLCARRWAIDSALEITVAAKQTPWIDSPPELPSEMMAIDQDMFGLKFSRKSMPSWTSHISRDKEKHDSSSVDADQN